ncbi:unnamed protein product, partial [Amoebophrya sp. A25]
CRFGLLKATVEKSAASSEIGSTKNTSLAHKKTSSSTDDEERGSSDIAQQSTTKQVLQALEEESPVGRLFVIEHCDGIGHRINSIINAMAFAQAHK